VEKRPEDFFHGQLVAASAAALLPQIGRRPGGSAILLAASTATDHARERGRTGRRVLSSVEGGHG